MNIHNGPLTYNIALCASSVYHLCEEEKWIKLEKKAVLNDNYNHK
jgi:hypothetical protein